MKIRQRVGRDMSRIDTSATMAGGTASLPVAFAPAGMLGIQNAGGEIKGAKAAPDFGVPFILPTMSIWSIGQVDAASGAPFWFQLNVVKDRSFVRDLVRRPRLQAVPTGLSSRAGV